MLVRHLIHSEWLWAVGQAFHISSSMWPELPLTPKIKSHLSGCQQHCHVGETELGSSGKHLSISLKGGKHEQNKTWIRTQKQLVLKDGRQHTHTHTNYRLRAWYQSELHFFESQERTLFGIVLSYTKQAN